MQYIYLTEAKKRLPALLDVAQQEPVTIRERDRDVAVVLSAQEYERLRALNIVEFERFCDAVARYAVSRGLRPDELALLLSNDA